MFYIIEALVVGLYTTLIYYLFSLLNIDLNIFILLFLIGFFKHFFGYYIGLHYYYCNYGEKCMNDNDNDNDNNHKYNSNPKILIIDSMYEGLIFIFFGSILKFIIKNRIVLFFILGFFIHILSEFIGYHKYFCINKCKKMINL